MLDAQSLLVLATGLLLIANGLFRGSEGDETVGIVPSVSIMPPADVDDGPHE